MSSLEIKVYCVHEEINNVEMELTEETSLGWNFRCPRCKRETFVGIKQGDSKVE